MATKPKASPDATERPAPLALVQSPTVSHRVVGSLDDRMRAYDQFAANMASLAINGWDTVQKCKAAAWLADGKDEHPAVFVENHYVMLIKGRLTIEPKWEYMVRKMKETVPGFRYKVLIETDDACKVEATDGVDTHVVEYTLADAKRQGLLGRDGGNMWTTGSTREGCFKQAMKRALRRLGVGRAAPWVEIEMAMPQNEAPSASAAAEQAISEAVVLEDEPAVEAGGGASGAAPEPSPATPPVVEAKNPIVALSTALVKMYGKQPKGVLLEKASLIYNEMMRAQTGAEHGRVFKSGQDIGPVEAEQMLEYLATREQGRATGSTPSGDTEVPPAPEAIEEAPPAEELAAERDLNDDYDDFMLAMKRARGLFSTKEYPRKFVTEAPAGSGKMWFVDKATFSQAGREASIKLSDQGEVVISQQDLQQLLKILVADCDKHERGGR